MRVLHSRMASLFRGGEVEVCSKQDGFVGSYYAATVIREHGDNSYAVQYKNLLEEDESRPLIEVVDAEDARPVPPKVLATGFALYEEVDAFDNDGWWVGKISGRKGSKYLVFFDEYGVEIAYPSFQLRAHLEWVGGKWVFPKNRAF